MHPNKVTTAVYKYQVQATHIHTYIGYMMRQQDTHGMLCGMWDIALLQPGRIELSYAYEQKTYSRPIFTWPADSVAAPPSGVLRHSSSCGSCRGI